MRQAIEPQIITITVPGFKKWQKPISKGRVFIALSCSFYEDPKIHGLQRISNEATHVYLWILTKLNYETESLTLREDFLRTGLKTALGKEGNRFDHRRLLNLLSNAGLIRFQVVSNVALSSSQECSKVVLNGFQGGLEQPQTQAQLDAVLHRQIDREKEEKAEPNGSHFSLNKHEENPKKDLWDSGVKLLTSVGTSEQSARSFIGKQIKDYGEEAVIQAIEATKQANPVEPKSYLLGILKRKEILRPPERTPEEEDRQHWLNNRNQWLRMPYAIPTNRDDKDKNSIKSTKDYMIDPTDLPWIVRLKSDMSETLNIKEWEPISYDKYKQLQDEQEIGELKHD